MSTRSILSVLALVAVVAGFLFAAPAQPVSAANCASYHYVQYGENLFRISLRYGTSVAELQRLNGMGSSTRIYAGTSLCVASSPVIDPGNGAGRSYVVQWGDTLARIARAFGVDMYVLARVNGIYNVNHIYAGQVLSIPDFTIQ